MLSTPAFDYVTSHNTLQSCSSFIDLFLKGLKLLVEHGFLLFLKHVHFTLVLLCLFVDDWGSFYDFANLASILDTAQIILSSDL